VGSYELVDRCDASRVVGVTSVDSYGRGSIITPEAVLLDFELAGLGSRSIAYAIDFAVQLIALFIFFTVLGFVAGGSSLVGIIILLVGLMAIVFGYPIAMETLNGGRTLGRMAVSTRVVTVEGAPVRFRQAFIRALLGVVDLYASVGTVAVVSALVTKRGQRLGDLVAGTMIIRQPKTKGSAGAIYFWPPTYLKQWASTVDTAALGNDVYQMIRDFLTRSDLAEPARTTVALDLSQLVEQRLPLAPRTNQVPPVDYLTAIAAATQGPMQVSMPPPPGNARPVGHMLPPPGRSRPAGQMPPPPGSARPAGHIAPPPRSLRSPGDIPPPPFAQPAATVPPPPGRVRASMPPAPALVDSFEPPSSPPQQESAAAGATPSDGFVAPR